MPRKTTDVGVGNLLRPPTFGGLLRRLRDERRISREKLAFAAGVSSSYITHLEGGDRDHPTRAVVDALIRYLDRISPLGDAERRHLFDLAGLAEDRFPGVEELRGQISDDMRNGLVVHEPNAACYLDTRWNILSCNDSYASAFSGLVDDGNMLRWFFGNELSTRVMVEWEREAAMTVDWLRGLIGQSGDTEWAAELLAELGEYPEFRRMWAAGGPHTGATVRTCICGIRTPAIASASTSRCSVSIPGIIRAESNSFSESAPPVSAPPRARHRCPAWITVGSRDAAAANASRRSAASSPRRRPDENELSWKAIRRGAYGDRTGRPTGRDGVAGDMPEPGPVARRCGRCPGRCRYFTGCGRCRRLYGQRWWKRI